MRLKVLFFPFALVTAVVMSIWYVWPAYQQSVEHKETLTQKEKQRDKLKQRQVLVDNLFAQLNKNTAIKDFIFQYIPIKRDEEYIIDAIDDAAKKAGIILIVVDVLQGDNSQSFFESYNEMYDKQFAADNVNAVGSGTEEKDNNTNNSFAEKIRHPHINEITADIVALGPYDGIRKFLDQMHKIDRMHGIISANLKKIDPEEEISVSEIMESSNMSEDNVILVQMITSFAYMGNVKIPRGADTSLFEQELNFDKIQTIQQQHMAAPPLVVDKTGRKNPFVREVEDQSSSATAPESGDGQ